MMCGNARPVPLIDGEIGCTELRTPSRDTAGAGLVRSAVVMAMSEDGRYIADAEGGNG